MRVMRVIAGNFPTNVNKVSKEKININVHGLKRPRDYPHHPHALHFLQAMPVFGSSPVFPHEGISHPDKLVGSGGKS